MSSKFHKGILFIGMILILFSCAQTRDFQDNRYEKIDGEWYLVSESGDQKFPIVKNTITLKYNEAVEAGTIKAFETENNLVFVRKAATGWYDYEITSSENILDVADQLLRSDAVAQLEIPTGGSYE